MTLDEIKKLAVRLAKTSVDNCMTIEAAWAYGFINGYREGIYSTWPSQPSEVRDATPVGKELIIRGAITYYGGVWPGNASMRFDGWVITEEEFENERLNGSDLTPEKVDDGSGNDQPGRGSETLLRGANLGRAGQWPDRHEITKAALEWCRENQFSDKDRGGSFIDGAIWLRTRVEGEEK